jgi:hypothetical protein
MLFFLKHGYRVIDTPRATASPASAIPDSSRWVRSWSTRPSSVNRKLWDRRSISLTPGLYARPGSHNPLYGTSSRIRRELAATSAPRQSCTRRLTGIRSSSPLSPTRSTRRSACESGWPGTSSWTCLPTRSGVYSPSRHRPPKSNSPMRTPRATEHRPFYDDELLPARSSVADRRKLHIGIASSRIGRPASIPDRASVTPAG